MLIVVDLLDGVLSRLVEGFGDELEGLVLRMLINVMNYNFDVCWLFVERGLLGRLVRGVWGVFGMVMKVEVKVKEEGGFRGWGLLDGLIIMLGVMINFCVYYLFVGEMLVGEGGLEGLIGVFVDNYLKMVDVSFVFLL